MAQEPEVLADHVIVCGWGRTGRACAEAVRAAGRTVVAVDREPARMAGIEHPRIVGNATDYQTLEAAGIGTAHALVAALDNDPDNLWLTVSARDLRPSLVIVARAADQRSMSKFIRAGADRVVNPQQSGGRRIGLCVLQRHVADFLDEVLHDVSLGYRMEAVEIGRDSPLAGHHIGKVALRENTGALLLAIRLSEEGVYVSDPPSATRLVPGSVLIVIGTSRQLTAVRAYAGGDPARSK